MHRIVLDTSFILTAIRFKIELLSELRRICDFPYKIYILDKTLDEFKNKKAQTLALSLTKNLEIIKTSENKPVDDLLLNMNNVIIATQDKALKEKLKKRRIPTITIRQKKYLLLENVL